jgi:hypothetical protein
MDNSKTNPDATGGRATPPEPPRRACVAGIPKEGIPALLLGTPFGTELIIKPPLSDDPYENCESAEHLIGRGVREHEAFEAMGVSKEQFYYRRADALRGQNADSDKLLRRYRRHAEKDAQKIARLRELLAASTPVGNTNRHAARTFTGPADVP